MNSADCESAIGGRDTRMSPQLLVRSDYRRRFPKSLDARSTRVEKTECLVTRLERDPTVYGAKLGSIPVRGATGQRLR